MTINVRETYQSPQTKRGESPETVTHWRITSDGDMTRDQAYSALHAATATVRDFLLKNSIDLTPTESLRVWNGTVTYKVTSIPDEDAPLKFKLSTRAARAKVHRSLATVHQASRGTTPIVDYGGATNVNDKGESQGSDIYAPQLEFSLSAYIPTEFFTNDYARMLYQYTPSKNLKAWGMFAVGEALYIGAEADGALGGDGEELTQLTFYFVGDAKESLTIADLNPTPIVRGGHDELWMEFEDYKDPVTGTVNRRPRQANVERHYPLRDFGDFTINP